jgi:hypothetical protein
VKGDGSPPEIRDSFEYRLGGCPDTTPPPAPVASPPAGTYSTAQSVTLTSEPGAKIHYTVDGSTPTTASSEYTGAIAVSETQVLKAIAVDAAGNQSSVATHAYTIDPNASSSYVEDVLSTPGLVSLWRLGESSGTLAGDAKRANPGAYVNGVLLGEPGALSTDPGNTAARFDGSNDHVSVPDASSLDTGDRFTLEAWVRRTRTSSTGTHRVMSKGDGSYTFGFGNDVLTLRKQAAGDVLRANVSTTDTATFHHVVATKEGATARLYIDGVDVTDRASVPGSVPVIANTTSPLNLGRTTNGTAYLPAILDEVSIYGVALTAAQVAQHFRAGRG